MHPAAYAFVEQVVSGRPWGAGDFRVRACDPGTSFRAVVDIGGRNINGSVRGLFPTAQYTALDLLPGPGVDVVANGATWRPPSSVDCVVCCEVLEHASDEEAAGIVANAVSMLEPGGLLVFTMASPRRAPHSAIDGGPLFPGEFYRGVSPEQLRAWLMAAWPARPNEVCASRGFRGHLMTVENETAGDLYAWAVKGV